jgi:hypothetical protein
VRRCPHPTPVARGPRKLRSKCEDVRSFAILKPELRRQKAKQLVLNVQNEGCYKLRPSDFMKVVTPAWNKAFEHSNNIKGWRDTGIVPFSRKVYHDLKANEARSSISVSSSCIDYTPLNSLSGVGCAGNDEEEEGEDGVDEDELINRGRISSAQLYSLGPVTADKAYHVVKGRHEAKKRAGEEAASRKDAREQQRADKLAGLALLGTNLGTQFSEREVKSMTIPQLQALLLRDDALLWESSYSKLKANMELVDAVVFMLTSKGNLLPLPRAQSQLRNA